MQNLKFSKSNLFILEGNIGAGKSTFLSILKKHLDLNTIEEPADKWQKVGEDGNLLDLYYKDTKRWAYTFQSYAFITRIQSLIEYYNKKITGNNIEISERSVYCDRYCFAKNLFELGKMTTLEWQIYKDWFAWLVENYMPKPKGFIYLRVSPEVCMQRLKKRNRFEESEISLDYLESLHKKHEDWLVYQKDILKHLIDIPVLTLECNNDFKDDLIEQNKHIAIIKIFINSLDNISRVIPLAQKQQQL